MEMDVFGRCVEDPEAFLRRNWAHAPVVQRPVDPPTDLLTPAEFERILGSGLLRVPYLDLVTQHGSVDPARYCPPRIVLHRPEHGYADADAVRRLIRDEHVTVLLRNLEQWHAPVGAFCAQLGRRLGRQVEAFSFVTPPGTQGRPIHRDDADVFVVQIAGVKRWQVHDGPADGHWEPGLVPEPGPVRMDATLEPGQVLYVPRGHAHQATAAGRHPSVHLSLTVRDSGAAHLFATLHALLADDLVLPARPITPHDLLPTADHLLRHYRQRLEDLTGRRLIAATRTAMRAPAPQP
ncbi:JmjC domain-containing protein [Nonomuraea typhae]|uniref:JmjC domain-containing protein n=1 Tax=Nonomuraea typhae TaxID=2603600 RepID=A0ABW7YWR0_9ACTN